MEQEQRLEKIIDLFKKFPGIGQRQAERFTQFIVRSNHRYIQDLVKAITALHAASKQCPQCFIRHQGDDKRCPTCAQNATDTVVVVEKDIDVTVLTNSIGETFNGYYFILGDLIPIAADTQKNTRMPQLINSIKTHEPSEVIIALSAHPDADHTARYITDTLQNHFPNATITTLGRGLSSGSELEYSDPETLIHAFTNRSLKTPKKG